jgi:hypothetical protein
VDSHHWSRLILNLLLTVCDPKPQVLKALTTLYPTLALVYYSLNSLARLLRSPWEELATSLPSTSFHFLFSKPPKQAQGKGWLLPSFKQEGDLFSNLKKSAGFLLGEFWNVRANSSTSTPKKLKECNTIVILFVSKPEDIHSLENIYKLEKDILFSLLLDQVPYAAVSVAVLYDHVSVGDGEPHSQQVGLENAV